VCGYCLLNYLSFRFVAASRKKSVHISVKSHNAEVKLCNLYQFVEAFNGIASCKIFCPSFMFHHFTTTCNYFMLFLHELKHVLVLVKQLTSTNVSITQILLTRFIIFLFCCCTWRNTVKGLKSSK